MKIRLEKIEELQNAVTKNNIPVGFTTEGEMFTKPQVGKQFLVGHELRTSIVEEILNDNTFKTRNSIYKITELN